MNGELNRADVSDAVKRLCIETSRLRLSPEQIGEDEPLSGPLLNVTSFGFVGMLLQLEDQLDVTLSEDLFVGRSFTKVADLVDAVVGGAA